MVGAGYCLRPERNDKAVKPGSALICFNPAKDVEFELVQSMALVTKFQIRGCPNFLDTPLSKISVSNPRTLAPNERLLHLPQHALLMGMVNA